MKKLYIVRHAKSSWKLEGAHDSDRPLKGRGIRDAYNTSMWLNEEDCFPDKIIASSATRALHTAIIFAKNLNYPINEIGIEPNLYEASAKRLLEVVKKLDDQFDEVMLFGHNPGITEFVNKRINHTIDNVPTTGVACLNFSVSSWDSVDNKAELVFFDYPKRRSQRDV